MANHKSSKKRIRQTLTKRAHNRLFHKTARNAVKALRTTTEKSAAEALLPKVTAMLDKLAKHNIVHPAGDNSGRDDFHFGSASRPLRACPAISGLRSPRRCGRKPPPSSPYR